MDPKHSQRLQSTQDFGPIQSALGMLTNLSEDSFLVCDASWTIVGASPQARTLLSHPSGLIGTSFLDWLALDERTSLLATLGKDSLQSQVTNILRLKTSESGGWCSTQVRLCWEPHSGLCLIRLSPSPPQVSEALPEEVMESLTKIGTWEYQVADGKIHLSPQMLAIFEVEGSPNTWEPQLEGFADFFCDEWKSIFESAMGDLISEGHSFNLKLQCLTARGHFRWIQLLGKAVTSRGRIVSIRGTAKDITNDSKLSRELHRFKHIVELAQEGIVELDSTGQVLYANQKLASLLATARSRLVGSHFLSYVAPEDRALARKVLLGSESRETRSIEIRLQTTPGRQIWGRFSIQKDQDPSGSLHTSFATIVDISAAKERETALLNANDRFSTIVNRVPVGLAFVDENLALEWTNRAWIRDFGAMTGTKLPVSVWLPMIFREPSVHRDALQFFEEKTPGWRDFKAKSVGGPEVYTSWACAPLADGRSVLICQNIDNRKRLEMEKDLALERTEFILEGAGLGAWDWDLLTNEVSFDKRWCTMLGLNPATTPQKLETWDSRVHPDDKAKAYHDIKQHLDGKSEFYENLHRLKHENGEWVCILDRGRISARDESGQPTRFTGTHFDVTKNQALKNRVRMITDMLGIGVWEYHFTTGELVWDKNMHRLYGLSPKEFSGRYEDWEQRLSVKSRERAKLVMERLIENESEDVEETFELVTRENEERRFLGSRFKITLDEHKQPLALYGINWDRTGEVILEESLEEARYKNIQSAKLALLGEMAGSIAHEINNPLTIITGKSEQVLRSVQKGTLNPEKLTRDVELILKTTDRIGKIVRGLRTFARQSDRDPLVPEKVSTILSDTLELCRERFHNNGVELRYVEENDGLILCRASQISQIVMNLLSNAFDAVSRDPGCWVELRLKAAAESYQITVTDSGLGIPPDVVDKLMQPFFTTKEVGKGTGLGLSIARSIAEDHGARFYYDQKSRNTCFVLEVPRYQQATGETAA